MKIWDSIYAIAEQIDAYTAELDGYRKSVEFSTVYLTVYEEGTYEEPSYWDRLGKVFFGSGKSVGTVFGWLFTALVAILPYFGIAAGGFGLYVLIKFIVCKAKKIPFGLFKGARARRQRRKEREKAYEERRAAVSYVKAPEAPKASETQEN